ncbi:hypothetical protein DQ04_00521150 [Trypanosoma grayi]|uniref:hypothetical protein n=1 Tax=Trypanosoma grayi TaxID=71804 RepID=UPI0004F3F5A3|nr:hypothetical protein DQ04_00521150 [Trypanosoma grayi]KEG14330.1 hypothetical protein DQ04_00521150 [Trypanosoma grayi]
MHSPPSSQSVDSAENIYNLLCAVQAQANADDEEIKALRLRIAGCGGDARETRDVIRNLSQQHEVACEELKSKRLCVQEQAARCAGVMEVLNSTRQEVAKVVEGILTSELPLHPAAATTAETEAGTEAAGGSRIIPVGPPQGPLPPAELHDVTLSLKRKIETAALQQRHRNAVLRRRPMEAVQETSATDESEAVGPFAVRFRREATTPTIADGAVEVQTSFLEGRRRRKVITFNDGQLEVRADIVRGAAAASVPSAHGSTPEKESAPAASTDTVVSSSAASRAAVTPVGALRFSARAADLKGPCAPRRTWWRTESHTGS